jgi:hypothetical protein
MPGEPGLLQLALAGYQDRFDRDVPLRLGTASGDRVRANQRTTRIVRLLWLSHLRSPPSVVRAA